MATRRGVLAALTGFVGGTAASVYTPFPERWLSQVDGLPAPPAETSTSGTQTRPPTDSSFDDETRQQAHEVGLSTREGVVYLQLRSGNSMYVGTGWVLDEEHIVTNRHVIERGGNLTCYTLDGDTLSVELVRASSSPDVGLLRTSDSVPTTLPTGSARDLDRNQPLVQVGNPGTVGNWVISLGRFAGRTGVFGSGDTLRTTVPTAQGNSGSPLVTLDGDVVGLTFASTIESGRFPGSAPEPSDDAVHESFESNSTALHVPIETVESLVDRWTAG